MKNKRQIIKISSLGILTIFFLMLIILVLKGSIGSFDKTIYNYISVNIINGSLTPIIKVLTFLGSTMFLMTLTLVLVILIKKNNIRLGIMFNLISISVINYVIKHIINRPRPTGINLVKASGYSFPSGHSATSMVFYGFLIYLVYKYINNKILKTFLIILLSIVILMIGLSRIYLGVHYASDVLAGFILGIIYLIIFITFIYKDEIVIKK